MAKVAEDVKKSLGTEEEPFEGEVKPEDVIAAIIKIVESDKSKGQQFMYIFDGYNDALFRGFSGHFGAPSFHLFCAIDKADAELRFKTKNEIPAEEALNEDQQE